MCLNYILKINRVDVRVGWTPYHNDMADAVGWIYGGWGRRMQLANQALNS
jgi:hypothetical protein